MKVLVCGGRNYDPLKVVEWLEEYYIDREKPSQIIEGGASGADMGGLYFGRHNGIETRTFEAEWHKYGKSAGFLRNLRMLEEGMPELIIAFPGGKGTANMVDIGRKAGISVIMAVEDKIDARMPPQGPTEPVGAFKPLDGYPCTTEVKNA